MNQLNTAERARIISCLVEGCSMRATVRLTGFAKRTVARFQVEIGEACARLHDRMAVNLKCNLIQLDEIWAFCYAKQRNVPAEKKGKAGDIWTWIAIDAETKLVISWHCGGRDASDAYWFVHDLRKRLVNRPQITSDGLKCYVGAIEDAFGAQVDYSQLVKLYGKPGAGGPDNPTEVRYSPPLCIGALKKTVSGMPDPKHVSTSYVERQNLTLRMGSRRFTRLTNGFSKKPENHVHAVALHFVHYNFCRIHQTLRITPAMEVGITDHVWSLEDVAKLLEG